WARRDARGASSLHADIGRRDRSYSAWFLGSFRSSAACGWWRRNAAAHGPTPRGDGGSGGGKQPGRAVEIELCDKQIEEIDDEELAVAGREVRGLQIAMRRGRDENVIGDSR